MQDVVGTKPSKWCAGCHDHAVFFNGRFDRPIKEQIDTPEAQAGLACTSCHSITRVHSSMGQGDFTIEYPPLHDLAASENPVLRRMHDQLVYLAPRAAPRNLHEALPPRADGRVLLVVPQGAPRRAGERLPLDPGLQRLRQLAGLGRLRPGRAILLLPARAATLRRLPHAARRLERSRGQERQGAVAPVSGSEYGAAIRQSRSGAVEGRAGLPPRRADLGRRVRHRPRARQRRSTRAAR